MIEVIPHIETRILNSDYRTEDVKFSPSGKRLAVVATNGCLLLFAVNIEVRPIRVVPEVELRSSSLLVPHGVDFLSEDVVVVANRNGNLVFFKIPPPCEWTDSYELAPLLEVLSPLFGQTGTRRKLRERDLFCGPGSVRVLDGILYVTCNYMNTVSTFSYQFHEDCIHLEERVVVAHEGLSVVDGIAISLDGSLMALSDHDHHRIAVYRRIQNARDANTSEMAHGKFELVCSLTDFDMHFPHGLRFDNKGEVLFAVDAGGRFIHVFETANNWQVDMHHCTLKTFGVDLSAFNQSKQAVPDEHRLLEGGGKGLDIDPSGRVLVVTCRNQSLRFFDIERRNGKLPVVPHHLGQVSNEYSDVALSCLVDDTTSIWRSIIPWLATATSLAKIPPAFIHIHHVCDLPPVFSRLCLDVGVKTHAVSRFDLRSVYSNKIIQGETCFGDVAGVLLTDVDVVFTGVPPFQEMQGFIAGKLVDMENPPLYILKKIFLNAGVGVVGIASNSYSINRSQKIFETIIGNFNGGMYFVPKLELVRLSQRWGVWVRWLLERVEIMERWYKHVDQIAFCIAVNELKIPFRVLDNLWNFPCHLKTSPVIAEPWILHHHAELSAGALLLPSEDPTVHNAIVRVNEAISGFIKQYELSDL